MEQNWLPQIKFLGSYTIPKIDVQLGGSFQSIPGVEYAASYAAPNADLARPVAQGGLGRLPAGGVLAGNTNLNIIQPGGTYGPRFNQIDMRLGKNIRFGGRRAMVSLDIFNILNSDTVSNASATYSTWLAPADSRGAAPDEGNGDVRLLSTATPSREVHCPAPLRRGGARGNRSLSAPGFRLPACFKAPAHGLSRQSLDPQSGATVATVSPVVFSRSCSARAAARQWRIDVLPLPEAVKIGRISSRIFVKGALISCGEPYQRA